ncbi:DUF2141 domain-containing protein [Beggiatoa alba]|nr:DUF2141 domain-containing protein [Beggiatoa alba]
MQNHIKKHPGFGAVVVCITAVFLLCGCAQNQHTSPAVLLEGELSLIINIDDLHCCEGILRLGLYHDSSNWLSDSNIPRGRLSIVQNKSERIEIHGLPAGTYAIAVHQDVNGDGKLNRRFGFLPAEPSGFSNNVGARGKPSFEQAAIILTENQKITINMRPGWAKR